VSQSSVCVCCKATLTGNYADDFDDDASDDDYDDDEFKEDEAADESNSSAYSVEEDILVRLHFLFFFFVLSCLRPEESCCFTMSTYCLPSWLRGTVIEC